MSLSLSHIALEVEDGKSAHGQGVRFVSPHVAANIEDEGEKHVSVEVA